MVIIKKEIKKLINKIKNSSKIYPENKKFHVSGNNEKASKHILSNVSITSV